MAGNEKVLHKGDELYIIGYDTTKDKTYGFARTYMHLLIGNVGTVERVVAGHIKVSVNGSYFWVEPGEVLCL